MTDRSSNNLCLMCLKDRLVKIKKLNETKPPAFVRTNPETWVNQQIAKIKKNPDIVYRTECVKRMTVIDCKCPYKLEHIVFKDDSDV